MSADRYILDGYFIAPDDSGVLWIWRENGQYPVPVLAERDFRDDPDVWEFLVAATEGAS